MIYMVLGGIAAFIVVKLVLFGLRKLALILVVVAGMVLGSMYWSSMQDDASRAPFERRQAPASRD